jgi:hypothetical protein
MQVEYTGKFTQHSLESRPLLDKPEKCVITYLSDYEAPKGVPQYIPILLKNQKAKRCDIFVFDSEQGAITEQFQFRTRQWDFMHHVMLHQKIELGTPISDALGNLAKQYGKRPGGSVILGSEFDIELDIEEGTWTCSYINEDTDVPCISDFSFEVPIDQNGCRGRNKGKRLRGVKRRTRAYNHSRKKEWYAERKRRYNEKKEKLDKDDQKLKDEQRKQREEEEEAKRQNEREKKRLAEIEEGKKKGKKESKSEEQKRQPKPRPQQGRPQQGKPQQSRPQQKPQRK